MSGFRARARSTSPSASSGSTSRRNRFRQLSRFSSGTSSSWRRPFRVRVFCGTGDTYVRVRIRSLWSPIISVFGYILLHLHLYIITRIPIHLYLCTYMKLGSLRKNCALYYCEFTINLGSVAQWFMPLFLLSRQRIKSRIRKIFLQCLLTFNWFNTFQRLLHPTRPPSHPRKPVAVRRASTRNGTRY